MAMFNSEHFYLDEKVVSKLQDYQIERINKIVADFIIPCEEDSDFYKSEMNSHFNVCFHDIFHNFVNQRRRR